ncbi:hypothetical protein HYS91_05110 [Candidatus Daviesbacteria bacterium]|nr:hypothetical protein [Candidatus Daviesbacteria bacterium]
MSFTPDRIGSSEWRQYPEINTLVDPNHISHPERLPHGKIDMIRLLGARVISPSGVFPGETLEGLQRRGLVLHVPCGIHANETRIGYSTPVGSLANAYGVDLY